jgi:hypothetical protein
VQNGSTGDGYNPRVSPPHTLPPWWKRETIDASQLLLLGGIVVGVVLRLMQTFSSVGSVDAVFWSRHVQLLERFGLRAYLVSTSINHPPLGLEIGRLTAQLSRLAGLEFADGFRLLQGAADVVTLFALHRLAARHATGSGTWNALLFFLSPATIFVSAFHCNSDPLMVMFLVLAVLATVRQRPLAAGLLLGAAVGVKIIALAAAPILLVAWRDHRTRMRFLAAAIACGLLVFLPGYAMSGAAMLRNVFGYTGWPGAWGFALLARLWELTVHRAFPFDASRALVLPLIVSMTSLWIAEARHTAREGVDPLRAPRVIGVAFLVVLFLASGFMPYYLFWLLPWIGFLTTRRIALVMHALISLYLFGLYTDWAGGWPWGFADGGVTSAAVVLFGLVVWIAIGVLAVVRLRTLFAGSQTGAAQRSASG